MLRRLRAAVVAAMCLATIAVCPSGVTADDGLTAVMDGQAIPMAEAAALSCHDFDYPVLTCFATASAMEADAARRAATASQRSDGSARVLTSGYVTVFEDGGYGGAALSIFHNYSNLGTVGWNDRISSLISYGATGHFYQNAPPSGWIYYFYSSSHFSYVGDYYNDKFSSVDLT